MPLLSILVAANLAVPMQTSPAQGTVRAVRITTTSSLEGEAPVVHVELQVDLDAGVAVAGLELELPTLAIPRFSLNDPLDAPERGFVGGSYIEESDDDGDGVVTWAIYTQRAEALPLDRGELRVQVFAENGSATFRTTLPPFTSAAPTRATVVLPAADAAVEPGGRLRIEGDGYEGDQEFTLETIEGPVRSLEPTADEQGAVGFVVPSALYGGALATVVRWREESSEREGVVVQRTERVVSQRELTVAGEPLERLSADASDVGAVELGVRSFDVWGLDPLGLTFWAHATATAPGGGLVHVFGVHGTTFEEVHRLREIVAFVLRRAAAGAPSLRAEADALAARHTCFLLGYEDAFEEAVQRALSLGLDPVWVPAEQVFVEGSLPDLQDLGVDVMLESALRPVLDEGLASDGAARETLLAGLQAARAGGVWRAPEGLDGEVEPEAQAASYVVTLAQVAFGQWEAFADEDGGLQGGSFPCADRQALTDADPQGARLVQGLLGDSLGVLELIDPGFEGRYHLARRNDCAYTARSQYLDRARLRGWNDSDLVGNERDNELGGNAGNNALYGGGGRDVAVFSGPASEYQIERVGDVVRVTDELGGRDGQDLCFGVEVLRFADRDLAVTDLPR